MAVTATRTMSRRSRSWSALCRSIPDLPRARRCSVLPYVDRLFTFAPQERKQLEEKAYIAVEKAIALDPDEPMAYFAPVVRDDALLHFRVKFLRVKEHWCAFARHSAAQLVVNGAEEFDIRVAAGQRDPDLAHRDPHLRAELQQARANGAALSSCQFGTAEPKRRRACMSR
jgi:hypothetical protein